MDEINLQLFSGGGAKSGLGGGRAGKDAQNSDAKTYRFWYVDDDGSTKYKDIRGDTPQEALENARILLKGKKIIKAGKKKDAQNAKPQNVTETVNSISDNKSNKSIDLSDSPLSYTKPPSTLSKEHLKNIKAQADKIKNESKEHLTVYDKNGKVIYENKGGLNSVSATKDVMKQADTDIHNHGRGSGIIGGTFSVTDKDGKGDVQSLVNNKNLRTSFASTKEGIYYISKTEGFKGSEFIKHMKSVEDRTMRKMNNDLKKLSDQNATGKISHKNYIAQYNKTINKALIEMHNEYLKGQKTYGYVYGLIKH